MTTLQVMTPAIGTYWASLATLVGNLVLDQSRNALLDQSVSHHYVRHSSGQARSGTGRNLGGYAFNCDGLVIGFKEASELHCQGAKGGATFPCGEYSYDDSTSTLSGSSISGPFTASDLQNEDDILISFRSHGVTCTVVSLNWPSYSLTDYLGLKCPVQNLNPDVSYEDNHFSFGISGDVALRSPLEIVAGNSKHTIVRDSYGIFQWYNDENIRMIFGPQQGRQEMTVLEGTLTSNGELFVEGYVPTGPCVHDGVSPLKTVVGFPKVSNRSTSIANRAFACIAVPALVVTIAAWLIEFFLFETF